MVIGKTTHGKPSIVIFTYLQHYENFGCVRADLPTPILKMACGGHGKGNSSPVSQPTMDSNSVRQSNMKIGQSHLKSKSIIPKKSMIECFQYFSAPTFY
jgi:hypothetical protein